MSQAQVRTEVEQMSATFSRNANAKDADALVRDFYVNDAVLLPPGSPAINGAGAIRGFWKGLIDAGAADVALKTVSVDSSGDLAYEIGEYGFTMPDGTGGKAQMSGKYLVVFKRQPNGTLRAVADMFSGNS